MSAESWNKLNKNFSVSQLPISEDSTGTWFLGIQSVPSPKLCMIKRLEIRADEQVAALLEWRKTTTSATPFSPLIPTPVSAFRPNWLVVNHLPGPQNLQKYLKILPSFILNSHLEQLKIANLLVDHLAAWWIELRHRRVEKQFTLANLQPNNLQYCPTSQELYLSSFDFFCINQIVGPFPTGPYTLPEWNKPEPTEIKNWDQAEGWALLTTLWYILTLEPAMSRSFGHYYFKSELDKSLTPEADKLLRPYLNFLSKYLKQYKPSGARPTLDQIINEWKQLDRPTQIDSMTTRPLGHIWSTKYQKLVAANTDEAQELVAKHFFRLGPAPTINPEELIFPSPSRMSVSWLFPSLLVWFISDQTRLVCHPLRLAMARDAIVYETHHPSLFELNLLVSWIELNQTPTLYDTNPLVEQLSTIWHDSQILTNGWSPQQLLLHLNRYLKTPIKISWIFPPNQNNEHEPGSQSSDLIGAAHYHLLPPSHQLDSLLAFSKINQQWFAGLTINGQPYFYDARLQQPLIKFDWKNTDLTKATYRFDDMDWSLDLSLFWWIGTQKTKQLPPSII